MASKKPSRSGKAGKSFIFGSLRCDVVWHWVPDLFDTVVSGCTTVNLQFIAPDIVFLTKVSHSCRGAY